MNVSACPCLTNNLLKAFSTLQNEYTFLAENSSSFNTIKEIAYPIIFFVLVCGSLLLSKCEKGDKSNCCYLASFFGIINGIALCMIGFNYMNWQGLDDFFQFTADWARTLNEGSRCIPLKNYC